MTGSLTVALLASADAPAAGGSRTVEDDLLAAALRTDTRHRFVVSPDCPRTRAIAAAAHATSRVRWIPPIVEPRGAVRAVRWLRRRGAAFVPFSPLNEALHAAGVQVAWTLGGSLVPLDVPYVATVWDLEHRRQPWFPETSSGGEWRERERLYREYLGRASLVIVGTRRGADDIRAAYGLPPGELIVLPLPTPQFALDAASDAGDTGAVRPPAFPPRFLLYPARFWAHKNHVTLVHALARLRSRSTAAPDLVFVGGDGGTLAHVRATARRLGVEDHVHCAGVVERPLLVALYRHAQALVFASLFGPDNLPPLEAMALGCPVVTARVPGAEDHLGPAALYVDPLDAAAWADAVESLDSLERRAALVAAGTERARRWTATQYARAVLDRIDTHLAPVRALWP